MAAVETFHLDLDETGVAALLVCRETVHLHVGATTEFLQQKHHRLAVEVLHEHAVSMHLGRRIVHATLSEDGFEGERKAVLAAQVLRRVFDVELRSGEHADCRLRLAGEDAADATVADVELVGDESVTFASVTFPRESADAIVAHALASLLMCLKGTLRLRNFLYPTATDRSVNIRLFEEYGDYK